ncbi:hypothetical protein ACHQM5_017200 [Ranunculus cassubicifolius]
MAETLSPNPKSAFRLQSPTSPFQLGSNDDQMERARVRAARAAAIRRKSTFLPPNNNDPSDPCFSKEQISELFQNCIRLASENKINQKNTWDLSLIDHLSELIKVEEEDDVETNFQKASCTLEAGVKIYASRVDSVHSEAYKVLGGINRAGRGDEQEPSLDGEHGSEQEEDHSKKEKEKKISPLTTLESSFDSLNFKKFDVAFAVDPLYHQTSAQFDEGGAKGLLLNNLGVYGVCRVVFDSFEVPGKSVLCETQCDNSATIDVSFAKECIEQMLINISAKDDISPSLQSIVDRFDEDNQRPSNTYSVGPEERAEDDDANHDISELDGGTFEHGGDWGYDQDDISSVVDENINHTEPVFQAPQEEYDTYASQEPEISDNSENVADFLFLGLGLNSNRNAWAGPEHWKYRKTKGPEDNSVTENGSPIAVVKKTKTKKQAEPDINFTNCLDMEVVDIFAPAKNPKTLLLPANRVPCNTTLPEDCHYQPENLVKLFLLPNTLCLGKRARKSTDESRGTDGPLPAWGDDEDAFNDNFDDEGNVPYNDFEDTFTLVSQRRQVNKIEVKYDKTSKQVDVHKLKSTLWDHIQESANLGDEAGGVSFKNALSNFPEECQAAALEDISPHLCFICLLHLANEHGLRIIGCANMDDLQIQIPSSLT